LEESEERLYLNCDSQLPLDGARRLGKDGQVGGTPTPADGTPPAVEEGEAHVILLCHLVQSLLQGSNVSANANLTETTVLRSD